MNLLKEPLLHFLITGMMLFGAYEWLNRGAPALSLEGPVRIGDGEIRWLGETFASQWRRAPTSDEMNGLVDRLVEEELLAREARALGLDQNDTIVRRRLAQKLSFLVDDTYRIVAPGDDELRRFHADHPERYRSESGVSFSHVFFSPQRRGDAERDAKAVLARLSETAGEDAKPPEGDRLLLDDTYADVDQPAVASMFGADFARALFALRPGPWSGPVRSGFGLHLVQVTRLRPAEPRRFEDVRNAVMDDWRRERESDTKAAYLSKLRTKYGVVVEAGGKTIVGSNAMGRAP